MTLDFYRQAVDLNLRDKREYTEAIYAAMGGMNRIAFSRIKALLNLSNDAFEMADRYSLDESQLRYVVGLEPQDQLEVIRQIIQFGLTRKQVKELIDSGGPDDDTPPAPLPSVFLKTLTRIIKTRDLPPTAGTGQPSAVAGEEPQPGPRPAADAA